MTSERVKPPAVGVCSEPGCDRELRPNPKRKGTRCQRCAARVAALDPAKREKCRVAMIDFYKVPGRREETGARMSKVMRHRLATDPAFAAKFRESGRRLGTSDKRGLSPSGSPERKLAAQRQSERALGDIPLEYRDEHRRNVKVHGIKSAESKRMIKEQVERDTKRFLASGELQHTKGKR